MWDSILEPLPSRSGMRYSLTKEGLPVCRGDVIRAWQSDGEFRKYWYGLLAASEFAAYRWETAPVTLGTLQQPFEFVLLDYPALVRHVDADSFAEHFRDDKDVVAFSSLGRDAYLVVPCPRGDDELYGHLATFVRRAPSTQQDVLWRTVGDAMLENVGAVPTWLSTAGMGVAWLHVRLDTRPKYYGHLPYKSIDSVG